MLESRHVVDIILHVHVGGRDLVGARSQAVNVPEGSKEEGSDKGREQEGDNEQEGD